MTTMRRTLAVGLLIIAFLSCSGEKENKSALKEIDYSQLRNLVHQSYFAPLQVNADLTIIRKDDEGTHSNKGVLRIDRTGTSRLEIEQKQPYIMTFSEDKLTIKSGSAKPMELDLYNLNHYLNVPLFREISVIEPNPFRYYKRFHKYFLDDSDNDSLIVIIREEAEQKKLGDTKVFIHRNTGFVLGLKFYSPDGDMGRRVEYKNPVRQGEFFIPSKIIIDFASEGTVVHEQYLLKNIVIRKTGN